jgi:hypothetical protein
VEILEEHHGITPVSTTAKSAPPAQKPPVKEVPQDNKKRAVDEKEKVNIKNHDIISHIRETTFSNAENTKKPSNATRRVFNMMQPPFPMLTELKPILTLKTGKKLRKTAQKPFN